MSLADTFSISSLSRRLCTRTFCGELIQDLKRSLVGFHINNDTNRKRLESSRLENRIKSSYPAWRPPPPPSLRRCFPVAVVCAFLSRTPVVYTQNNHGQTKNDRRRCNISERNFTGGREGILIILLQSQSLTFVLLSICLHYTTDICLHRQQQPTSHHHHHNLYFPYSREALKISAKIWALLKHWGQIWRTCENESWRTLALIRSF